MQLQFIELEDYGIDPKKKDELPKASYVKKEFCLNRKVRHAELIMTALGVYEVKLNGKRVGNRELAPGFTNYNRRLQYQTYDVTPLLRDGKNVLLVIVGNGWYRGNVGAINRKYVFGTKLALAARLVITCVDETQEIIETDESWMAAQDGPLETNDLKILERYDARKAPTGWHSCRPYGYQGKLIADEGELLCEQEHFSPVVLHCSDGNTVLDFGQNMAGMIWFRVNGPAGRMVSVQMGETLDENGNFTLSNLQGDGKNKSTLVNQKLEYILKEGEQEYRSKFLICGFRYALLMNWPQEVIPENFEAIAVYSNLDYQGDFSCSNEKINQLVRNVRWSMKSNFVDIPTDCPHRERAGWAGDVNVFCETADYLADTRRFFAKWLNDFVQAQKESGALPYIIPEIPMLGAGDSSAGWSDAIAAVPLMQYQFYGDDSEIRKCYETVKKYVEYNRKRAEKNHWTRLLKKGKHTHFILDTGFHYGEWLEPGGSNIKDALRALLKPDAEVATAWFFYTVKNLAEMAKILGNEADYKKYKKLAELIRKAYQKEFLMNGKVVSERQCKYVRPLYMGLISGTEAEAAARKLNEMVIKNDYKIGTGFLTTYQILQVLTDSGYSETAYCMLEQEECPGWLYEVKKGATTMWEGWNAIGSDGKLKPLSQNHFSPGAAISWLFSRCAGIRPLAPGFQKVLIRPFPGGDFRYAKAKYQSVYGLIEVSWELEDENFILNLICPPDIEAEVRLPDGTRIPNAKSGEYKCRYDRKCF